MEHRVLEELTALENLGHLERFRSKEQEKVLEHRLLEEPHWRTGVRKSRRRSWSTGYCRRFTRGLGSRGAGAGARSRKRCWSIRYWRNQTSRQGSRRTSARAK